MTWTTHPPNSKELEVVLHDEIKRRVELEEEMARLRELPTLSMSPDGTRDAARKTPPRTTKKYVLLEVVERSLDFRFPRARALSLSRSLFRLPVKSNSPSNHPSIPSHPSLRHVMTSCLPPQ